MDSKVGGGVERGMVDGVARLGRVFTFRTYGFHALRTLAARFAVFGIPLGADRARAGTECQFQLDCLPFLRVIRLQFSRKHAQRLILVPNI